MNREQRMNDLIDELITKKTTDKSRYIAKIDDRIFISRSGKSAFKTLGQFKNALSTSLMLSSNKGITANDIIMELGDRFKWIRV